MSISTHTVTFPVRMKEVAYDHVYFGVPFTWFEVGRSELSRAAGLPYATLVERGYGSFVTFAAAEYRRPIPPTGFVRVEARIAAMTRLRFAFAYAIRAEGSDEPCVVGRTEHAMADKSHRLCRVPADFATAFAPTGERIEPVTAAGPERAAWRHAVRIRYEETDEIGVVYYGNYFALMEAAWSARLMGGPWDVARGIASGNTFGVVRAECRYASPARYDDPVVIEVGARPEGRTRVRLDYRIAHGDTGTTFALGTTEHVVMLHGRPARLPDDLAAALGITPRPA